MSLQEEILKMLSFNNNTGYKVKLPLLCNFGVIAIIKWICMIRHGFILQSRLSIKYKISNTRKSYLGLKMLIIIVNLSDRNDLSHML